MTTPAERLREALEVLLDRMGEGCGDHCSNACRMCQAREALRVIIEQFAALAASGHSLPPVVEPCAVERSMATAALDLLKRAAEFMEERAPDAKWWREYFLLTGQHMILTEHGWECGSVKDEYLKLDVEEGEEPGNSILDEVNAPSSDALAVNEPASQRLQRAASGTVDAPSNPLLKDAQLIRTVVYDNAKQEIRYEQPSPTVPEGASLSYAELDRRYGICRDEIIKLRHELEAAQRQPAAPSGGLTYSKLESILNHCSSSVLYDGGDKLHTDTATFKHLDMRELLNALAAPSEGAACKCVIERHATADCPLHKDKATSEMNLEELLHELSKIIKPPLPAKIEASLRARDERVRKETLLAQESKTGAVTETK